MVDYFPAEIVDYFLSFIPEYAPVTRRVCRLWSALQKPASPKVLLDQTHKEGNIVLYYWLMSEAISPSKGNFLQSLRKDFSILAAEGGNLPLLEWSLHNWSNKSGQPWDYRTIEVALRKADLKMLDWLRENSPDSCWKTKKVCRAVVESGSLKVLDWLAENLIEHRNHFHLAYYAAKEGNLAMLKYGYGDYGVKNKRIYEAAASSGQLDIVKWLHQKKCSLSQEALHQAAYNGHLEILKYLKSQGLEFSDADLYSGAKAGQAKIVKWMIKECFPGRNDFNLYPVAAGGNLKLVNWLYQRSLLNKKDSGYWFEATEKGDLAMLRWLHQEGFRVSNRGSINAAREGHLEVLKWFEEIGLPLDLSDIFATALEYKKKDIIYWLFSKSQVQPELNERRFCYVIESACSDLALITWLRSRGAPLSEWVAESAARRGKLNIFLYLLKEGCPWNKQLCLRDCSREKEAKYLRKWLNQHQDATAQ